MQRKLPLHRISRALLELSLSHNATALLLHATSKIPPRYATSALTYIMGQALKFKHTQKDPNLVGALSGHKDGSKAFARYRDIDEDMKKELVGLLE